MQQACACQRTNLFVQVFHACSFLYFFILQFFWETEKHMDAHLIFQTMDNDTRFTFTGKIRDSLNTSATENYAWLNPLSWVRALHLHCSVLGLWGHLTAAHVKGQTHQTHLSLTNRDKGFHSKKRRCNTLILNSYRLCLYNGGACRCNSYSSFKL